MAIKLNPIPFNVIDPEVRPPFRRYPDQDIALREACGRIAQHADQLIQAASPLSEGRQNLHNLFTNYLQQDTNSDLRLQSLELNSMSSLVKGIDQLKIEQASLRASMDQLREARLKAEALASTLRPSQADLMLTLSKISDQTAATFTSENGVSPGRNSEPISQPLIRCERVIESKLRKIDSSVADVCRRSMTSLNVSKPAFAQRPFRFVCLFFTTTHSRLQQALIKLFSRKTFCTLSATLQTLAPCSLRALKMEHITI